MAKSKRLKGASAKAVIQSSADPIMVEDSNKPCYLLDRLPPEIRNYIWELAALDARAPMEQIRTHPAREAGETRKPDQWEEPPLLRSCKQIRAEAYGLHFVDLSLRLCMGTRHFGPACAWFKYVIKNSKTSKACARFRPFIVQVRWRDLFSWFPLAQLFYEIPDLTLNDKDGDFVPELQYRVPVHSLASNFIIKDISCGRIQHALEEVVALGKKGHAEGWTKEVLEERFEEWIDKKLEDRHIRRSLGMGKPTKAKAKAKQNLAPAQ